MAEPLTNSFGPEIPRGISDEVRAVHPSFDSGAFCHDALAGYAPLGLLQRGRHIARALRKHLPADYRRALGILIASLGPRPEGHAMASFFYLPHTQFVAEFGLGHPTISLDAQHALTKRFTAEFSIRPYLIHHRDETLERLRVWVSDPDEHVRRLVSEGTRPRLPWAPRLPEFQRDPAPVLPLLEALRDDPSLYVRRSVANHLNDIGKDHPALLSRLAAQWLRDASAERRWVVTHALRSAVKRGEPGALKVLGCDKKAEVKLSEIKITPKRPAIGDSVAISCRLTNPTRRSQQIMADLAVHFVKARGQTSGKVFKLKRVTLAPGESCELRKTISLAVQTTRMPYPGRHRVDVILNGASHELGAFHLFASSRS